MVPRRRVGVRRHDLFEEYVLRDEHEGRTKGADQAEKVGYRHVKGTSEHDAEGEW